MLKSRAPVGAKVSASVASAKFVKVADPLDNTKKPRSALPPLAVPSSEVRKFQSKDNTSDACKVRVLKITDPSTYPPEVNEPAVRPSWVSMLLTPTALVPLMLKPSLPKTSELVEIKT